jgi:Family of unknown function (DUF6502)
MRASVHDRVRLPHALPDAHWFTLLYPVETVAGLPGGVEWTYIPFQQMDRNSMNQADPSVTGALEPTDARARIALRTALGMLVPLARWLVRNGVHYASFAPALKSVFVEAARRELAEHDGKITDSALSVLSGVHRRDIRAMSGEAPADTHPKSPSVASQVFTRWLTDAQLRGADDQPMALPKAGEALSFDTLARQVSSDVHPRTLLAEMQRLGLVAIDGDRVHPQAQAFVPQQGFEEMAELFSANVGDHLAAAAHNLNGRPSKFLEQSIFGSGLSPQSTDKLGTVARKLWKSAFQQMADEASQRLKQDAKNQQTSMRMRFGVYYFAEAQPTSAPAPAKRPNGRPRSTQPNQGSTR